MIDPTKPTMGVIKKTGLQQNANIGEKPATTRESIKDMPDRVVKSSDLRGNSGKNIFEKGI